MKELIHSHRAPSDFSAFPATAIEQSIPQRFEKMVRRHARRPAVVTAEAMLTYDELNRRANQVAHTILDRGGGGNAHVVLFLEKGAAMTAAILGVLKAGCTYVPMDPAFPAARNRFILEDSGAELVVTNDRCRPLAESLKCPGQSVLTIEQMTREEEDGDPGIAISPDSPAYLIYTSGSTGRPKGVLQNHRNLLHGCMRRTNLQKVSPSDRMTLLYSCSVMGSVYCLFGALLNGAALYPYDIRELGLTRLAAWIEENQISIYHSVASVFRHFAAALSVRAGFPSVRLVIFGGERVLVSDVRRVREVFHERCELFTGLGSTETGTVRKFILNHATPVEGKILPLGYPVDGMEVMVLGEDGRPAAPGEIGEIVVRSRFNALGYWRQVEATERVFAPDPVQPGVTMYHTGDLGSLETDGLLRHRGRKDFQVKVRGFRIEVAEIEMALLERPDVGEAVVVAREDESGENQLIAYLVMRNGANLDVESIRRHLHDQLPYYMIPAGFVRLDAMPLTPNNKIDRNALPAAPTGGRDVEADFVPPESETEHRLAAIWGEVLHRDHVGCNQNFFALGGHSLSATQVLVRVADRFGVELAMHDFFAARNLKELAVRVDRAADANRRLPPVEPWSDHFPAPLSFAQQRMWFLEQLNPGSAAYHISNSVRLRGVLDADALEAGFNELIRRHACFRTVFELHAGEPRQRIREFETVHIPRVDFSSLPAEEGERRMRAQLEQAMRQPFDLAKGPLFHVTLVRLASEDHVLILIINHIIYDNIWSSGLLFRELGRLYDAHRRGTSIHLPKISVEYADYALWQQQHLTPERLSNQLDYWKKQLAEAPPVLEMPADRSRPAISENHGGEVRFQFPREIRQGILGLAGEEGATAYMVLLAALQILLYRYSGQKDILVGSPVGNRPRVEIEPIIGLFINTLVMRARLHPERSFREFLREVKSVVLEAFAHQDLPFEHLVAELHPERNLAVTPIFQVMFLFQHAEGTEWALPGLEVERLNVHSGSAKYDLTLSVTVRPDALVGALEFNAEIFDLSTIERLVANLETLLRSVMAEPEKPVSRLSLLSDPERRRIMALAQGARREPFAPYCVHEIISLQAARSPDRTAAVFESQRMSYRELEERSNQLARHLQSLGVEQGALVGVFLDRSLDMLVSLLGILKTGAAYVPMDPDFPAERLKFILADTGISILITSDSLQAHLPKHAATVFLVDRDHGRICLEDTSPLEVTADPQDIAYVLFTSGSTGQPKGVAVPHRSLTNFLQSMAREPGITSADYLLAVTTISFDISTLELFLPLICGACVEILSREVAVDGAQLARKIKATRATVLQATPATWRALVAAGWKGSPGLKALCGGEALTRDLLREVVPLVGSFWNMYGPTETTVWSTCRQIQHPDDSITIGRPIANTQTYVLDRFQQLQPLGVPGELYIGGDGVASGYLHRPELTAERFLPDPFCGSSSGRRLYMTGDLVRLREDGELEFLGRLDSQIKLRGFRIELGEIESLIAGIPGISACAVDLRELPSSEKVLVAYLVFAAGAEVSEIEVRSALEGRLPAYMVPPIYQTLEALPLTVNGKLDRRALPAPQMRQCPVEDGETKAKWTLTQYRLGRIWKHILQQPQVGLEDNFFALGGTSLSAVRLFAEIKSEFGCDLPLTVIFERPSLGSLAMVLDGEVSDSGSSTLLPLSANGQHPPLFCFHGIGSHAYMYQPLARELTDRVPVIGIQGVGLDGRHIPDCSLEEMVAGYVEKILQVQPEGPLYLAGFCAGGLVAYEAAQQLSRRGYRVACLFLIESGNFTRRCQAKNPTALAKTTSGLDSTSPRLWVGRVKNRLGHRITHTLRRNLQHLHRISYRLNLALGRPIPPAARGTYVNDRYSRIIFAHAPEPYTGDVIIFRSERNQHYDFALGWQGVIRGSMRVYEVPGDHHIWKEEYVGAYAKIIHHRIEAAAEAFHLDSEPAT